MDFLNIFISVVFPVFLMAAVGALVHRFRPISPEPLSQAILFIFSPALVFNGLATTQVALEDLARIAAFSLLLLSSLYVIAYIAARAMRVPKDAQTTFVIAALFMNAGNYGLPVAFFAFGDEGLAIAVVFFVTQAILAWTVGAFIASRAQSNLMGSLVSVAKLPTSYAAVLGLAVSMLAIELPDFIQQPAQIMGDAAIPAMLIVLGIQLASTREMAGARAIAGVVGIRLVLSSLVAYGLVLLLQFDDLTSKVLIVVAGMPTAVLTIILATQYKGRPELASGIVVAGTLASLVSVTVVLSLVGAS